MKTKSVSFLFFLIMVPEARCFLGFFCFFFSENTSSNSYGDSLSLSSELTCEHFNGTGKLYTSKKVRFNYPEKERSKIN